MEVGNKPNINGDSFTSAGNSGRKLTRKFSPRCSAKVMSKAEGFSGMTLIMGGTFDDASRLKPTSQSGTRSALARHIPRY